MSALGRVPGSVRLRETTLWRRLRHRVSLLVDERTNSHFTGFMRLPTQFGALAGSVTTQLRATRGSAPLSIGVLGCSNGAEAYTISSVLRQHHPDLAFRIVGLDIDRAIVEKASTARYQPDEIFNNKIIPEEFVAFTFDRDGDAYRVKPHIAERVRFDVGNVLDPRLASTLGACDIVFAQNFLFHLKREQARAALENIATLFRSGSFFFGDGVDLDLRSAFVRRHRLAPVAENIQVIHDEARRARAIGWPYEYWGLEPFLTAKRNWRVRYATIFRAP